MPEPVVDQIRQQHWLVVDEERRITGCHCGFVADLDSDVDYGDSVLVHIIKATIEAVVSSVPAGPVEGSPLADQLADAHGHWCEVADDLAARLSAAEDEVARVRAEERQRLLAEVVARRDAAAALGQDEQWSRYAHAETVLTEIEGEVLAAGSAVPVATPERPWCAVTGKECDCPGRGYECKLNKPVAIPTEPAQMRCQLPVTHAGECDLVPAPAEQDGQR